MKPIKTKKSKTNKNTNPFASYTGTKQLPQIREAVKLVISQYGQTLKKLATND